MKLAACALGGLLLTACSWSEPEIHAERVVTAFAEEPIAQNDPHPSMLVDLPKPPVVVPRGECKIGTRIQCMPQLRSAENDDPNRREGPGPYRYCVRGADGAGHYSLASCNTPLVFAPANDAVVFTHAGGEFHVGTAAQTEWVSGKTPWLALDRDGNGVIDAERELFAGFGALAALDANGDGVLDRRDPAYGELVLWSDGNQDKACTPDELLALSATGITRIPLTASIATPQLGSYEGETVSVEGGRIVDVYLADETFR